MNVRVQCCFYLYIIYNNQNNKSTSKPLRAPVRIWTTAAEQSQINLTSINQNSLEMKYEVCNAFILWLWVLASQLIIIATFIHTKYYWTKVFKMMIEMAIFELKRDGKGRTNCTLLIKALYYFLLRESYKIDYESAWLASAFCWCQLEALFSCTESVEFSGVYTRHLT